MVKFSLKISYLLKETGNTVKFRDRTCIVGLGVGRCLGIDLGNFWGMDPWISSIDGPQSDI